MLGRAWTVQECLYGQTIDEGLEDCENEQMDYNHRLYTQKAVTFSMSKIKKLLRVASSDECSGNKPTPSSFTAKSRKPR
ncbi:hypothetical protein SRHO_G00253620 [Serrasalmus rhombeus]